ncbi:hypothetical protein [Sphingopyxis sp. RIFCSPHIGHO2_12_FULL_65_19]|uniref:hypothetical protein n=1 Tax=Sphingopyxis sp. RIFCSPHIGHO2_12_FULL_65_19 TaxID=1802172 RepID=UPI0008AF8891|nr:hypothetical protein [Sphingopyxis sp. RIFCSPHIGHO2_12_FULL_65_19]OHD05230.1 MAG: hypothetical protein A3E77_01640 [Sphingopyxis sp. RIFCSPHIGHO2_12_FULL_65_19]
MLHFYDRAGFARALTLDLEPNLHRLLAERIGALSEDLVDYTEYLVVHRGDTEADIIRHIGLSPLIEPMDSIRFGEPGFRQHWDWLAKHDGWFELIFTFGSTFAYVLFIENDGRTRTEILEMCRHHA